MAKNYFKDCKDCPKREVGCQATCETHLKAKAARNEERYKVFKERIYQNVGNKYNKETAHRLARRYRGK